MRSAIRTVRDNAARSPYVTVAVLAAVARLAFASVSFVIHQPWLIPDEQQYVELAATVASGHGAESWSPGYGQSLYDTTRVFMVPLTFLFELFGPSRIIGQLLAATFGVATAVATAVLARRIAGPRAALLAGAAVAVMPSQVLWSSVVLRESMTWFALVLAAIGVMGWLDDTRSPRAAVGLVAGATLALGFLRVQTMLAAVAAVVLVAVVVPRAGRVRRIGWALVIAVLVPAVAGAGPAGYELAKDALPNLATRRTLLSDGADSAFTSTSVYQANPGADRDGGDADDGDLVRGVGGRTYVVDESFSADLRAIPSGAVATTVRPFLWEQSSSTPLRIAAIENLAWYVLYAVALVGVWRARRRWVAIAFPVACAGAILAVGFVTQANLGTAFRHRGQIFWALAVLAAVAVELGRERSGEPDPDLTPHRRVPAAADR